jgi:hypothetical protein
MTRPSFMTTGYQSWSWSKQSWRMFLPSLSIMNRLATQLAPPTHGTPWKQPVDEKMIFPLGR